MKILVVDDDKQQRDPLVAILNSWSHETATAINGADALERLEAFPAELVITDLKMPRMDGFQLMDRMKANGSFPTTIVLTAFGSLDMALATVHDLGGFWFLEKPVSSNALRILVDRASAQNRLLEENSLLRRDLSLRGVLCDLVGTSPQMQEVFSVIQQVAPTDVAVLITGESGTGKELVARAIHSLSVRKNGPFVAVNCAALPESLVESEIFGHEKGAFTGAAERRIGCMELAEKGTLFLDELAEMPLHMQAKLLRVLQDLRYRRLGGKEELKADIRVIAATNRRPQEAIEGGQLREDLYYRLSVFHMQLPPLRDRREDIPSLVDSMLAAFSDKYGMGRAVPDADVLALLTEHPWVGNVRELRNVVERAYILAGGGEIHESHLPSSFRGGPAVGVRRDEGSDDRLAVRIGMTVDEAERVLIEATLSHARNNKTRAAAILGISTKTMHAKLRAYRLGSEEDREE